MERILYICCLSILFVPGPAPAQEPVREWHSYALPAGGTVLLEVPAGWQEEIRRPELKLPPTIVLRRGDELQLLFTPLQPQEGEMPPLATLEEALVEGGRQHLPGAIQDSITLEALEGGTVVGRYYRLTEKDPPPDEYPSVISGVLVSGPLVGSFTVLVQDPHGDEAREALRVLGSATFEPQSQAGLYRATMDDLRMKVLIAEATGLPVETLTDKRKRYEVKLGDYVLKATVAKGGALSIRVDGDDPEAAAGLLYGMTIGFERAN